MLFKKSGPVDWLVVFLGNPGAVYSKTRHNAGFMTADVFEKAGVRINRLKFKALTGSADIDGVKLFLMKPQTYMNLSGDAVREAMAFYKLPLERVIVVSDDVALLPGKLRIRRDGTAGGHNGLKDIIAKCGGDSFIRVKIGVGKPAHPDFEMADWVLSTLFGSELQQLEAAAETAAAAVKTIVTSGVDTAMNRYN
ncbi:aminoacyl-tRNA hydrolase [Oscillospiraceae bacterium CM]|nr:aminoacyl-tRNA hydrolase [Oscillospiraceae bacterium CM]